MSEVQSGLEGVVAFATEIAEPDKAGGALRYRGVDIEDLVGHVPYEKVWGLLVDGSLPARPAARRALAAADPLAATRASTCSRPGASRAGVGLPPAHRHPDERGPRRTSPAPRSWRCRSSPSPRAGAGRPPVPQTEVDKAGSIPERFLIRWRGEADPRHVKAIDAYWISAAEHGMNASTFTARVIASTGADVAAALSGAVGALSGPLHGGAPSRVLKMLDDVERRGRRRPLRQAALDRGSASWASATASTAPRTRAPGCCAAPPSSSARRGSRSPRRSSRRRWPSSPCAQPDRVLATNVEFWSAVVLDFAEVPPDLFTPLFTCARVAGWSAHILEQKREGRLIRPTAKYVGPGPRAVEDVPRQREPAPA